jgi:Ca-activated chloride channel family protein
MKLFAADQMLWLLLVFVPPLIAFLVWSWRKRQQLVTQFVSARLLGNLKIGVSPFRQKLRMTLIVISVILLILTLARPQWGFTLEEARQRGLDIMVAIDTSNSMLAEDIQPNRLARAKLSALDLMRRAKSDRLGLIAFAGTAFLQCPLTLDDGAFSQSVDSLDTRTISDGGTALAEAIDTAAAAFKDEADNHKVLILFTDGEDHDSEAVAAAEKAAKAGMRIFTIGIGTPDGELLRIRDERGRTDYIRDEQGQPVKSHLNEQLLQEIATTANGFYLPLRGTKVMDTLYERGLAPLPKAENSSKLLRRFHERFHWPLAIAIILLIIEIFIPDRKGRRRSHENTAGAVPAPPVLAQTMTLLLLLALPLAASGSPSKALREYEAGKYEEALKDYRQSLEKKKDDPRLNFNAGAAAYQSKQFEEAAKQFNESLNSPDLKLQQEAYYNLGNTYYRMGQTDPDTKKKQEAWENALKHFDSALKLNKQDPDSKFNQDFVQHQLEELKKQQQQQQQQNQDKQDKQDQKQDQKNQQSKDQNQSDKDKESKSQQQQSQDKSQQSQDSQKKDGEKQDQKDQGQSQADKDKNQEKKDQSAQGKPSEQAQDKSSEEAQREAAMMAAGQMTPKQAQQLLDAQKGKEEVLRLAPTDKQSAHPRSTKNW